MAGSDHKKDCKNRINFGEGGGTFLKFLYYLYSHDSELSHLKACVPHQNIAY